MAERTLPVQERLIADAGCKIPLETLSEMSGVRGRSNHAPTAVFRQRGNVKTRSLTHWFAAFP
jgi:hypothetical protein